MGVNSLTRSFALEWSDYGIRAIGVSPGAIADTAGTAKLGGMGGSNPKVIPTPSHLLDRISPIFSPFFLVFCAFSPPRRDGSNEPQAGTQGQETAGTGVQTAGNTVSAV